MIKYNTYISNKKYSVGIIVVNKDKILLGLRSETVNNPNTWGIFGGNVDFKSNDIEILKREAIREFKEETDHQLYTDKVNLIHINEKKKYFYFYFISYVDLYFDIKLNDENSDFRWFTLDEVDKIKNLHPKFKAAFKEIKTKLNERL